MEAVADSSDAVTDPEVFDIYRSLLKCADTVPGPIMSKLLDSISSGLLAQVDATIVERLRTVVRETDVTVHGVPQNAKGRVIGMYAEEAYKRSDSGPD